MDWAALLAKKMKPPFMPAIRALKDVSNFDEEFTRLKPVLTLPRTPCVLTAEQQEVFADFDFSYMSWPKILLPPTLCAAKSLWKAVYTYFYFTLLIQQKLRNYRPAFFMSPQFQVQTTESLRHSTTGCSPAGFAGKRTHFDTRWVWLPLFLKSFCLCQIDFERFNADCFYHQAVGRLNIYCVHCMKCHQCNIFYNWTLFQPCQSKVLDCKYVR